MPLIKGAIHVLRSVGRVLTMLLGVSRTSFFQKNSGYLSGILEFGLLDGMMMIINAMCFRAVFPDALASQGCTFDFKYSRATKW